MTSTQIHPDWNNSWVQNDIRGYAERAVRVQSRGKTPNESTIKKYEFVLREYMAQVKEHGIAGAAEAVANKFEFMGISNNIVYAATRVWREENKVPTKLVPHTRNNPKLTSRIEILEKIVREMALQLGMADVVALLEDEEPIDSFLED